MKKLILCILLVIVTILCIYSMFNMIVATHTSEVMKYLFWAIFFIGVMVTIFYWLKGCE